MNKLKWILRDCNIYMVALFTTLSFLPSLSAYIPLTLSLAAMHLFKIIKMFREKIFFISNFNLIMALTCFIPLIIDFHINSFIFSIFLIVPVSLKALLFTRQTTAALNKYLKQHQLDPAFIVVIRNELNDYLIKDNKSTVSHYFYISDIEFRLTSTFKGIFFNNKLIPFYCVQKYCIQHGIEYADIKQSDADKMTLLVG